MKFYSINNAKIIESETLITVIGFLNQGILGARNAKAAALFPFVLVRKKEFATPVFINHERIHFRQQIELLFVGVLLLQVIESIYAKVVLKLGPEERYLHRAVEQEAYRNQENFDYLKDRRPYAVLRYITDKKKLAFVPGQAPKVIVTD